MTKQKTAVQQIEEFYKNADLDYDDLMSYVEKEGPERLASLGAATANQVGLKEEDQAKIAASFKALKFAQSMLERNGMNPEKVDTRFTMNKLPDTPTIKYMETMREKMIKMQAEQINLNPSMDALKAKVASVSVLPTNFLENHPDSPVTNVLKAKIQTAGAAGCLLGDIKLVLVKAATGCFEMTEFPETSPNSPLSSKQDVIRAAVLPSFYGVLYGTNSAGQMPKVGDIVKVRFNDETNTTTGVYESVFQSFPEIKGPPKAKRCFQGGAPSSPLGD